MSRGVAAARRWGLPGRLGCAGQIFRKAALAAAVSAVLAACGNDGGAARTVSPSPAATADASATIAAASPPTNTTVPASAAPGGTPTSSTSLTPTVAMGATLISAARGGDLLEVRRLLGLGASVTVADGNGETALIAAARARHFEVAEVLIAAGADVNARDRADETAYLLATSEVGRDARALAFLRLTLRNGADIRSLDSYRGTGLIRAADRGYVEIVQELLTTRIAIDHVNRLGWTALLEAIILGGGDAAHTEVVRILVAAGADVNLADGGGVSPLQHAISRGHGEIAAILRAAGAR